MHCNAIAGQYQEDLQDLVRPETRCWLEEDSWSGNTSPASSPTLSSPTFYHYLLHTLLPCPVYIQYSTAVLFLSSWNVTVHAISLLYSAIYLLTLEEDSSQSAGCSEATIIGNPPSHLIPTIFTPCLPEDFRLHSIQDYCPAGNLSKCCSYISLCNFQPRLFTQLESQAACGTSNFSLFCENINSMWSGGKLLSERMLS